MNHMHLRTAMNAALQKIINFLKILWQFSEWINCAVSSLVWTTFDIVKKLNTPVISSKYTKIKAEEQIKNLIFIKYQFNIKLLIPFIYRVEYY